MFEIIDSTNAHEYEWALDQMFQLRYQIYVKERGWDLKHENGRERDQFDHEAATYLLAFDKQRNVAAGGRFIPSTAPHLLADVFPHLVERGPVPRGPSIWEFTRIFVAPRHRETGLAGHIGTAVAEYLNLVGATHMTCVCDTFFVPFAMEAGWDVKMLGLPVKEGNDEYVAIHVPINEAMLDSSRRFFGPREPVVCYADPATGTPLSARFAEPQRLAGK